MVHPREPQIRQRQSLRIRRVPGGEVDWTEWTAGVDVRWEHGPTVRGAWQSTGSGACLVAGHPAIGDVLPAGWYELAGWLERDAGEFVLPSVRLRYAKRSALAEVELLLPDRDSSGRFRMLALLLQDVESLEFLPGVQPVRFRVHDFAMRRLAPLGALLALARSMGVRRMCGWAHSVALRGRRRATDQLLADYRRRTRPSGITAYAAWVRKYDSPDARALDAYHARAQALRDRGPLISLLVSVADSPVPVLRRFLDSVVQQAWPHWELCAGVDEHDSSEVTRTWAEYAERDPRIRMLALQSQGADASDAIVAAARGDFVAPVAVEAELASQALLRIAESAAADPEIALVYTDEDALDVDGARCEPCFKPDWNPDLLLSHNYIGHLVAIRTELVRERCASRAGFGCGGGHDRLLRCSEGLPPRRIGHIPEVLYHGRVAAAAVGEDARKRGEAAARAVAQHLGRIGSAAVVEAAGRGSYRLRIRWPLPKPAPKASLIIPTRDRARVLQTCVESILAKSTYPDFEVVVVDNRSSDRAAREYLRSLAERERVRVLAYDAPFNFSAINNWAVAQCDGRVLALVNNDIEVITPGWLEEMVGLAARPDTGAVGAMLYYPDDTIQHAGMVLGIGGVAGHVYAGKPRGFDGYAGRARAVQELSAVTGACMVVRREVFDAVGGLDERLPVEFNDVDFCLRVRERGYRNVWTPFAELYHHESASRVVDDPAAKQARRDGIAFMLERWGDLLRDDPAYNPNLSLESLDFGLAFPPRQRVRGARANGEHA